METETPLTQLAILIQSFAEGRDQTVANVREMDAILSEAFPGGANFPDKDAYDELEIAVACYKPGGGQFMYDEAQMAIMCRYVLARLGKTIL